MQHDKNSLGTTTTLERPLLGRIIGWNALLAALVAATLIAASMIQLRSGQPLSAGAAPEIAGAADEAAAAAMPLPAVAPAQSSGAGICETVSDSAEFEVGDSRTLSVPGFDTANGELTSVIVGTSVSFVSAGSVSNAGTVPFTFESFPSRTFVASISGPDVAGVTIDRSSPLFTQIEIPADTTMDISVGSDAATGSDTPALAGYIGGTISFPATSEGDIAIILGPNADATIRSTVIATVEVTYCFTPPPMPVSSDLTLSKTVVAGAGTDAGSFSFNINCGGDDIPFQLSAGQEITLPIEGAVDGTTVCNVTENVDTSRWSTEVNGACATSVSVTLPGRADFTNTLRAGSETPLGACA